MYTFVRWNYIFIAPPLCINKQQIDEGLAIISEALLIADDSLTIMIIHKIHYWKNLNPNSLINKDLAPVTAASRTWGTWNYAALWISMSLCIPTYTMASSMINEGMSWWQAVLTIFAGNAIVLVPMLLNGHAGAKYGIPFPVFARASFGTKGANIPAMLRAIVACGWFGIQTWIGGASLYNLLRAWNPSLERDQHHLAVSSDHSCNLFPAILVAEYVHRI